MIKYDYEITVNGNQAKLNKDIYLFRGNKNVHYYFAVKNASFNFKGSTDLIEKTNAINAAVTVIKPNNVEVASAIAKVENGKIHLKVTEDLIDEEVEVGDFDLVFDLFDDVDGAVTIPKVAGQFHVLERPCTTPISELAVATNTTNEVDYALTDYAITTYAEPVASTNADGTFAKKTWVAKEKITTAELNRMEEGISDVSSQCKDIAKQIENGNIGNNVEPALMDMPRIYFSEGNLPTTKTATTLRFDYYSKTKEYHGWAEIKCQGNSSMSYPKKNFTIKLYKDKAKTEKLKIDFKGWGKQSKFVLKANWIDITHARNVVSARIWGDIVKSRSGYANLPELLKTSPNQGAIDGFPITVYGNGYYQGRYTLNIPKDKWMANMDDSLDTHCILCGENYNSGCFRALPSINGSDWTDELHDTVPATIKTSWTNAIQFVMTSSDSEFKANLQNYFNVESLIDYLLYGILSTGLDAFGKNQIYMTYDGIKWIASMYDMDSTWGLWWNGSKFVETDYAREEFQDLKDEGNGVVKQGNLLYLRLQNLFVNEIKARYTELRQNKFTYPYLINKFEEFIQICPNEIVKEDYASTTGEGKFTSIPLKESNNIQQLRSYINARLTYVDSYINSLVEPIPCTAITLDKSTLSFTTADAQTLTATVTPTNTTNPIVWSVSPSGICSIENGVVTPITSSGNCIITATCGEKTATCNVNVNVDLSVKGLTLNKKSTNLTISTVDESNINLLEGIGHDKETGDILFDEITFSPGVYVLKNINQGDFTYLGYYVGNVKYAQNINTTDEYKLIVSKTTNIKVKLYNKNATVIDNNIGLFRTKSLSTIATSTPFVYESVGAINSPTSTDCQISQVVKLDTNKHYILRKTNIGIDSPLTFSYKIDNKIGNWKQITELACDEIGIIENASSIQISYAKDKLSSIELVEVDLQDASSSIVYGKDTLTATLTPTNATNKAVTWSTNNENVELIVDGLNCTVKAKTVGNSVVTCTSSDSTNGTISDTCNVTIS